MIIWTFSVENDKCYYPLQIYIIDKKGGFIISKERIAEKANDSKYFLPIYRDIAAVIGVPATKKLYFAFRGQQLYLPNKICNQQFIQQYINDTYDGHNMKKLVKESGYSDRQLRRIKNESKKADV